MSHSRPFRAPDASPWLPDAWFAPELPDAGGTGAGAARERAPEPFGGFVAGWAAEAAAGAAADARVSPSTHALDALLPEFGTGLGRGVGRHGDHALDALAAEAADAREAEVRAELAELYAAELAARDAAHGETLEQAWADGHAAGHAAGEAQAHAMFAEAAGALDAAVRDVQHHEERWLGDLRAHVAALAVAVAQHVVGREVAADDALVVALVARAVAEFPAQEALVARVHPADLDALKAAWAGAAREGEVRWTPDARVARGGALIEGRERIVDGRVDAALERLYRALGGHAA